MQCVFSGSGDGEWEAAARSGLSFRSHQLLPAQLGQHGIDLAVTDRHEISRATLVSALDLISRHRTEPEHAQHGEIDRLMRHIKIIYHNDRLSSKKNCAVLEKMI